MSAPGAAPRATLDLKVRVWGMGANDQPFFQSAVAQNISTTGACIYGIERELKVGDVIGVQFETRKARCKIVWIVDAGGLKKMQVGVQLVSGQECPWMALVPADAKNSVATPQSPDNRRHFQRHKVSFPIELRDERVNMPMRVNASDVSGSGCYVETVMPLALATSLKIDMWIGDEHLSTSAVVRTRDPGVGMGIEFTGMLPNTKSRLQAHLDKLDPGIMAPATSARN
ncbi:MAG TPA: PilZ domain-containing protein [Candidatus Sulfotelmatobacter sp.]